MAQQRTIMAETLPLEVEVPQTHVFHQKISSARKFILNRPDKLNALNLKMTRNITPQLKAWDVSKLAKVILVKGAGDGRFCVGDDIADTLLKVKAKDPDALLFFQEKSTLVHMISTLETPYVTILDGYALGAALGLFAHGPFRIATERTIFSLPEVSIGVPLSSGSSFFLPKLDGELGTYLALTGSRLQGIDTFFVGIATHYVPSSRLPALEDRLADLETSDHSVIQRVIEEFVEPVDVNKIGCLKTERETIDRCFRYNTVDEILEALDREKSTTWIRETKRQLLSVSPTSLRVILRLLRKAESMSLRECLEMEFDLIQKFMVTKDFHEGVDAMFLSKPRRKPHWEPSTLAEISEDDIDHLYFNYPSPNALTLPTKLDLKTRYPYSRFALPSEEDVRLAIIGNGPEFGPEHRLTNDQDVLTWFMQGYRGKWGVQEKILDILQRKTVNVGGSIVWK